MPLAVNVQYQMLKAIAGRKPAGETAFAGKSKLLTQLGQQFMRSVVGPVVIDYGCCEGHECIELAKMGLSRVIGIDIRENVLNKARINAAAAGVSDVCEFTTNTAEMARTIISIDTFEHFDHPERVLETMRGLLLPGGSLLISFGPTWLHPLGGHLFSVFPWAHLVLSERALIRWRSDFKSDGATKFSEVEGGLNQMTIARFERIVRGSGFTCAKMECLPIQKLRVLHGKLTREFTTAIVRCRLESL